MRLEDVIQEYEANESRWAKNDELTPEELDEYNKLLGEISDKFDALTAGRPEVARLGNESRKLRYQDDHIYEAIPMGEHNVGGVPTDVYIQLYREDNRRQLTTTFELHVVAPYEGTDVGGHMHYPNSQNIANIMFDTGWQRTRTRIEDMRDLSELLGETLEASNEARQS